MQRMFQFNLYIYAPTRKALTFEWTNLTFEVNFKTFELNFFYSLLVTLKYQVLTHSEIVKFAKKLLACPISPNQAGALNRSCTQRISIDSTSFLDCNKKRHCNNCA